MDEKDLSRREILAGLTVTGAAGALVGGGTGSFFSDTEMFANNAIASSEGTAGVVELNVDPQGRLDTDNPKVEFEVSVPNEAGQRENPAFICVRTNLCPFVPENSTSPLDPDDLRVQLVLECDSGSSNETSSTTLLTGSLREVLDVLQRGVLLACDETDICLKPGGDETLTLTLEVLEVLRGDDYTFEFALDFEGEQCRYNDLSLGSSDPLGIISLLNGPCEGTDDCPPTGNTAISFIAFCRRPRDDENVMLDPQIELHRSDSDGFTSIIWSTAHDVDFVVVFGGQKWTLYDYTDTEVTTGVATNGGYTDYDAFYESEGEGSDKTTGTDLLKADLDNETDCQPQSCPCEVAEDILADSSTFEGTSVKLEYDESSGQFVPPENEEEDNE